MRHSALFARSWIGAVGIAMVGCTMAPFYHRPAAPVPGQWIMPTTSTGTLTANAPMTAAADLGWREFFKDPLLQQLLALALANNRDLRVAALNVEAARAQYRIQRATLLPTIDAAGAETAQRLPGDLRTPGEPSVFHEYSVGLGVTSYELDLFGRLQSLSKAALEQYFGYTEVRRNVQITLVSQIADAYVTWLADGELLRLTQNTLASQQASYELSKRQFDVGVITALDLKQAETSVDTAKINLALYTRQKTQAENALQLLVGAPLPAGLAPGNGFDGQNLLAELPEGIPSDVLTRRPDVLAAEFQLKAANANIGAARAQFFPSILLTGSYGTASTSLDGLFKGDSRAWNFNPQITMPIFAAGANIANLKLSNVQKQVMVAQYEKAVQTAFQEVADALAGRLTLDEQTSAQQSLVDASSTTYMLSDLRFRTGIDSYLTVLVSQRALYQAQQDLINVKLLRLENLVTLYKALGGGWNEHTPSDAQPMAPPVLSTFTVQGALPVPPMSASSNTPLPITGAGNATTMSNVNVSTSSTGTTPASKP